MPGLLPEVDPDGLLEYSVVYTDRSLNHMSRRFQDVLRTIAATLRRVYGAEAFAAVPGGGTYAMEAVARQFATEIEALPSGAQDAVTQAIAVLMSFESYDLQRSLLGLTPEEIRSTSTTAIARLLTA